MSRKLKKTTISTVTFEYKDGYFVDVVRMDDTWDVWVYHKDICAKSYMFGLPVDQVESWDDLLDIIAGNIDRHIDIYRQDYIC